MGAHNVTSSQTLASTTGTIPWRPSGTPGESAVDATIQGLIFESCVSVTAALAAVYQPAFEKLLKGSSESRARAESG